jgi:hypothetical protein
MAFNEILNPRYNNYLFYIHNLSNFDGVFLLKELFTIPDIKPKFIYKDGKIISLKINFNPINKTSKSGTTYTTYNSYITLFDSLLILPLSLDKLSKTFGDPSLEKGMFPIKVLLDPNFSLDYEGEVPGINYTFFPNATLNPSAYMKHCERYEKFRRSYGDQK